jgi:hypothetical protein
MDSSLNNRIIQNDYNNKHEKFYFSMLPNDVKNKICNYLPYNLIIKLQSVLELSIDYYINRKELKYCMDGKFYEEVYNSDEDLINNIFYIIIKKYFLITVSNSIKCDTISLVNFNGKYMYYDNFQKLSINEKFCWLLCMSKSTYINKFDIDYDNLSICIILNDEDEFICFVRGLKNIIIKPNENDFKMFHSNNNFLEYSTFNGYY